MKHFYFLIILFTALHASAQLDSRTYLTDAIIDNGEKYLQRCERAILDKDMERVNFLFDSITTNTFHGVYFDNFELQKLRGKKMRINEFEKPVVLITLSTWYLNSKGEINAINDLAKKYKKKIDFVVLYWGTKKESKKAAKSLNSNVTVAYVDELDNKGAYIVQKLKHFFGFPTCYYLNADKSIAAITRGAKQRPFYFDQEDVYEDNYDSHFTLVKELLVKDKNTRVATK